jgi:transposase
VKKNTLFSKGSSKLHEEHRELLVELIDKKPALVLDQVMDDLASQFMGLEVSKTALYDFTKEKCRINLKKAHFHSVERNLPENPEKRHDWETGWQQTDMDI